VLKLSLLKILNFRSGNHPVSIGVLSALIGVFAWTHVIVTASETIDPNAKNNKNEEIRITSDKLFAEIDAGVIEFVGNVKATQAETVITADRLKIFYHPDAIKGETTAIEPVSIEKIIANGHVKINYNNIIAETDEAEYTLKSEVLVLKGEQSKVSQKGHSITGTTFTLYRSDGKITVESSAKQRVKAVFQPSEKDK
jgi:lipopolysaccharide export system protein LptA